MSTKSSRPTRHSLGEDRGAGYGQGAEGDSGETRGMSEWQTKRLGDVLQLNYGKSLPLKNRVEGPIPVYGSNGVVGSHNEPIVDKPGLVVGRKGSAGEVHFSRGPFCPIDTTFYVTGDDAPGTDLEFLFYLLRYVDLTRITGDVGVPGLNREMAYMEPVRFPIALPEQKKIAHILSTVQRAIEAQERIIQTTTELKKALMNKLFTEGLRHEPQKQTEIGPVPESWEVVPLGELVNFTTGKLNSNAAVEDGEYPFFTCSKETFWIDNYAFDTEAILLSGNNAQAIYSVKHYKGKFNAYQRTYVITVNDTARISYRFLSQMLSRSPERLRVISIGSSTKYLTLGLLLNLPVAIPTYAGGVKIGDWLDTIDQKIQEHEAKRKTLQDLVRTLLHELMTAKTRVHELEFST